MHKTENYHQRERERERERAKERKLKDFAIFKQNFLLWEKSNVLEASKVTTF